MSRDGYGGALPSPDEQNAAIARLLAAGGEAIRDDEVGTYWHLISGKWWEMFRNYVGLQLGDEAGGGDGRDGAPGRAAGGGGGGGGAHSRTPSADVKDHDHDQLSPRERGVSRCDSMGDPPGPMNNDDLLDEQGKVRPGLVDKENYVLVRAPVFALLKEWYGLAGDDDLGREVVAHPQSGELRVDFHPLDLALVACDPGSGEPLLTKEEGEREGREGQRRLLLPRSTPVPRAIERAYRALGLEDKEEADGRVRLWLQETAGGRWLLLPATYSFEEVVETPDLALMVEVQVQGGWVRAIEAEESEATAKEGDEDDDDGGDGAGAGSGDGDGDGGGDGPPSARLQRSVSAAEMAEWREGLGVGSECDAQDEHGTWFEGIIEKGPDKEGNFHVHFKGWLKKFDEWIPADSERLKPQWTEIADWRSQLRTKQVIDVKVSGGMLSGGKSRWQEGTVRKIDFKKGKLEVEYGGGWQRKAKKLKLTSEEICPRHTHTKKKANRDFDTEARGGTGAGGVCGLRNLGNTCYMNSMLQCLAQADPLTTYFTSGAYKKDINRTNFLGTGGKLATEYAQFLQKMWSGKYSSFAPSSLKREIGDKFAQFQGQNQHDSQELLTNLMDAVHEDVNRVKKPPYVEGKDQAKGQSDASYADDEWERYRLRNQSAVVDMMTGQFRSHLLCPGCKSSATRFDPFTCVPCPIPVAQGTRLVVITLVRRDPALRSRRYGIRIPKRGGGPKHVAQWLAEHVTDGGGVDPDRLQINEVYSGYSYKMFLDASSGQVMATFSGVQPRDVLVAYEVAPFGALDEEFKAEVEAERGAKLVGQRLKIWWPKDGCFYTGKCQYYDEANAAHLIHYDDGDKKTYDLSKRKFELLPPQPHIIQLLFNRGRKLCTEPFVPLILSFGPDATNADVRRAVWDRVETYLVDDHGFTLDDPPYELCECAFKGTQRYAEVPMNDDTIASSSLGANGKRAIMCDFTVDGFAAVDLDDKVKPDDDETIAPSQAKRGGLTLEACLEKFRQAEVLGEDDQWYCPKCKEHVQATKQMSLWRTPEILVVQLKRFMYEQGRWMMHRERIDALVDFPFDGLDLSDHVQGMPGTSQIYDLFAISNHHGGLGGGHYTAYTQNMKTKLWYNCNDSRVNVIPEDQWNDMVTGAAYVLFYRRRDVPAKSAGKE